MKERKFKFGDRVETSSVWEVHGHGSIEFCDAFCKPKGEYRYEVRLDSGELAYFSEEALSLQAEKQMKVLIACELSGTVRDAFNSNGHVAMSCDIEPSETEGWHYQGDVFDIINLGWDMMICHPPCTFVCGSGWHWCKNNPQRQQKAEDAILFATALLNCDIPKIAMENPVGVLSTRIRKPDQYIQPHEYGHDASKKTCLWLKGLPKLKGTMDIPPRIVNGKKRWENQTDSGQNRLPPSADRGKIRSMTYQGWADAMANQWG